METFRILYVVLSFYVGISTVQGQCGIQNCQTCIQASGVTSCSRCNSGYFPLSTTCTPCSQGCQAVSSGAICDGATGVCASGCKTGWVGEKCDRCDSNYYSAGGTCYKCSDQCVNSCDGTTGSCFGGCRERYWGTRCENTCSPFCVGQTCDYQNATCTDGCVNGFYDNRCETPCGACKCDRQTGACLGSCDDGWYGEKCDKKCNSACYLDTCQRNDGHCTYDCPTGFYGPFCSTNCSSGCDGKCNRDNGVCSTGCKPGLFGDICTNPCNVNCKSGYCDRSDGVCVGECKDGFFGDYCSKSCASSCSGNCDKNSGFCSGSERIVSTENDNLPLIVGLSAGGGFLLIIIIVTVICMQQLRSRRRLEKVLAMKAFHDQNGWTFDDERLAPSHYGKSSYNGSIHTGSVHGSQFHGSQYFGYDNVVASGGDIHVKELNQYVARMIATEGAFEKEHKRLPIGLISPCTEAQKEANSRKNRYKNIYAYDHSRVLLKKEEDTEAISSYINANFINGFEKENRYIAAQGPTENTVDDFWRMIWQNKCSVIVMLTKLIECGVSKCLSYWPIDENEYVNGGIRIKFKGKEEFADFTVTYLILSKGTDDLSVTHCQFTTWPDRGVPQYVTPLVEFLHKIKSIEDDSPLLVHCSAGVGRTGAFIAVHYLFEEAQKEQSVNIFNCVKSMREQRINMVQTPEQYRFIHECILEALTFSKSIVKSSDFRQYYARMMEIRNGSTTRQLEQEFLKIKSISKIIENDDSAHLPENQPKNRTNIVARDSCRVFLWSSVQGCNDYVNAIYIPNYRRRYAYIITEMPQTHTIIDFCRLLQQEECRTIVMLNSDQTETQDGKYWADPGESVVCGPFRIAVKDVSEMEHYICRTIDLHYSIGSDRDSINLVDVEGVVEIRQYQIKSWSGTLPVPDSVFSVLAIVKDMLPWQTQSGNHPILVHCKNGADRSGLFCLCAAAIDRVNSDGNVAMPYMLNHIRARRKELVPYFTQYKFCHDVVDRYVAQPEWKSS